MKRKPGTYALILRSHTKISVRVGKLGQLNTGPAYFIYIGSAFGPGGVRARVLRHFRQTKTKHWHIDYLREFVTPVSAWYSHELVNLEHRWARAFSEIDNAVAVKGFGCSDCTCFSHLFTTSTMPDFKQYSDIVGAGLIATETPETID